MTAKIDGTKYLEQVKEKLKNRMDELNRQIAEGQKDIESMHEYYWENYTEMDQYGYEDFDNQQALLHQVNANQENLRMKHRLERWISSMTERRTRRLFISASGILRKKRAWFR